ncbi:MAG: c-type cytochrome [Steroidobacteraceae bacterium]
MNLIRLRAYAGQAAVLAVAATLLGALSATGLPGTASAGTTPALARLAPGAGAGAGAGGVATDSGRPAISWTWTTIAPAPGEPRGYVAFQRACSVCHGGGPAKPGTRALRAKYRGKLPALLARRTDLTAAYVKYIVRHGVSVMPPFRKTELSDGDLDAIAAYLGRKRTAR